MLTALAGLLFFHLFIPLRDFLCACGANVAPPSADPFPRIPSDPLEGASSRPHRSPGGEWEEGLEGGGLPRVCPSPAGGSPAAVAAAAPCSRFIPHSVPLSPPFYPPPPPPFPRFTFSDGNL